MKCKGGWGLEKKKVTRPLKGVGMGEWERGHHGPHSFRDYAKKCPPAIQFL
jgi:hypothetical protein